MKEIHPIQLQILRNLLFAKSLRYSEMKPDKDMENNQFDFHLHQLINANYIVKTEEGYQLTSEGKEFANRMDTDKSTMIKQAKISAIILPMRITENGIEYLIYTRLKQPFFGCQGFMSGKVTYGEKVIDAARREFKEETNLNGDPEVIQIRHYRVFDETTNQLVEDKFMFFCKVLNPTGEVIAAPEGKYEWVHESKIYTYVTNHFESMDSFKRDIKLLNEYDGNITFVEFDHFTKSF
jgi:ADP-ribose pyrophosphatase YjhB (NUDIX family)